MPSVDLVAAGAATKTQLAAFRALRQARKQTNELAAQLALAHQHAAQLDSELTAIRNVAYLQQETIAQATAQMKAQRQQDAEFASVLAEMRRTSQLIESAHQETVAQLEASLGFAQSNAAAAETARRTAEAAAAQHAAAQLADIAKVKARAAAERTELEGKLQEAQQQLSAAQQTARSLLGRLEESEEGLRVQRVQLDETALALSELRAAASSLVTEDRLAKVSAELGMANQLLAARTRERDEARQAATVTIQVAQNLDQKLQTVEADLAKKNSMLMELGPKLEKAYAQLLLIKEKRDWRL